MKGSHALTIIIALVALLALAIAGLIYAASRPRATFPLSKKSADVSPLFHGETQLAGSRPWNTGAVSGGESNTADVLTAYAAGELLNFSGAVAAGESPVSPRAAFSTFPPRVAGVPNEFRGGGPAEMSHGCVKPRRVEDMPPAGKGGLV